LQIARTRKFDRIVFMGDVLDLPEWQDKFLASPEFYFTTQPTIIELAWWLRQFRAAQPDAEIDILEGNHELRMRNALVTHLRAAYNLRAADKLSLPPALSIQKLLALDSMHINWVAGYPNACVWLNDALRCTHGENARSVPGETARAMSKHIPVSTVFAHIHRLEQAVHTQNLRNETYFVSTTSIGCLCRIDGTVPGHSLSQNWQQGFGIATFDDKDYQWVETAMIHSGKVVYGGRYYEATDRREDLRLACKGWNW
jgi:hypothetical protein